MTDFRELTDEQVIEEALNAVISYYSTHEAYQEWIIEKETLR